MNKPFTASEVHKNGDELFAHNAAITRSRLHAYVDRLEADEIVRVQRGVWVLVPRDPTEGMLKAAEDAVNAASNCESTTDDLSAIAYKAALAAAPQSQAAELVAEWEKSPYGDYPVVIWHAGYRAKVGDKLYTIPQPCPHVVTDREAKDAQLSDKRVLRELITYHQKQLHILTQQVIDDPRDSVTNAAMAKESGR